MTFYVVILGMCKFTVVNDRKGHGVIDFVYPGTYKVILRRQKFGQVRSKFYYIKQDFIVLRGSSNFFKVLCREFVIVQCRIIPYVATFKSNKLYPLLLSFLWDRIYSKFLKF